MVDVERNWQCHDILYTQAVRILIVEAYPQRTVGMEGSPRFWPNTVVALVRNHRPKPPGYQGERERGLGSSEVVSDAFSGTAAKREVSVGRTVGLGGRCDEPLWTKLSGLSPEIGPVVGDVRT